MSNVIELKLNKPKKDASLEELSQALDELELVEAKVKILKKELMDRWRVKQKVGDSTDE